MADPEGPVTEPGPPLLRRKSTTSTGGKPAVVPDTEPGPPRRLDEATIARLRREASAWLSVNVRSNTLTALLDAYDERDNLIAKLGECDAALTLVEQVLEERDQERDAALERERALTEAARKAEPWRHHKAVAPKAMPTCRCCWAPWPCPTELLRRAVEGGDGG